MTESDTDPRFVWNEFAQNSPTWKRWQQEHAYDSLYRPAIEAMATIGAATERLSFEYGATSVERFLTWLSAICEEPHAKRRDPSRKNADAIRHQCLDAGAKFQKALRRVNTQVFKELQQCFVELQTQCEAGSLSSRDT